MPHSTPGDAAGRPPVSRRAAVRRGALRLVVAGALASPALAAPVRADAQPAGAPALPAADRRAAPHASGPAADAGDAAWRALAAAPGVDAAKVAWLERTLTATERRTLLARIRALSAPQAAQLLGSYLHADGSTLVPFTGARALADSLLERPPAGEAGVVHVAYLAARLRTATIDGWTALGGVYRFAFGAPAAPPATLASRPAPRAPTGTVQLRFDLAPAESLLAIVATPDVAPAAAAARLAHPAFDALIAHHSQDFYRLPWTRELMAVNLARAASTLPVDRLYAWANPKGFLDYADVAEHRAEYRALLDALRADEATLLGGVARELAVFVPAGERFDRTITLLFADGADGWASDGVAAVDLEWFKDDRARLRNVIAHEAFHVLQHRRRVADAPAATPQQEIVRSAVERLYGEGTANYLYPARPIAAAEREAMVRRGVALLDSALAQATAGAHDAARATLDRGIAGGGPFYWLGAEMSAAIVARGGMPALAATLPGGGPAFARAYLAAVAGTRGARSLLSPAMAAAVRALR